MQTSNPIDLLFGGMEKPGPGGNVHTLHVLRLLPTQRFPVTVDAGCGSGRQTLVLAQALGTPVHAVDAYEPFLQDLVRRAKAAGSEHLILTHCMDMQDSPDRFPHLDLLWSAGAAYHIGFAQALPTWASAIHPGGFAVVSELSWLRAHVPQPVREFFRAGYPAMHSLQHNIAIAEQAGYRVLTTDTLPKEAWVDGYYAVLAPRAKALVDHPDASVRDFAASQVLVTKRGFSSHGSGSVSISSPYCPHRVMCLQPCHVARPAAVPPGHPSGSLLPHAAAPVQHPPQARAAMLRAALAGGRGALGAQESRRGGRWGGCGRRGSAKRPL